MNWHLPCCWLYGATVVGTGSTTISFHVCLHAKHQISIWHVLDFRSLWPNGGTRRDICTCQSRRDNLNGQTASYFSTSCACDRATAWLLCWRWRHCQTRETEDPVIKRKRQYCSIGGTSMLTMEILLPLEVTLQTYLPMIRYPTPQTIRQVPLGVFELWLLFITIVLRTLVCHRRC